MPTVRLQSAGSQVVAKAGVNFFGSTPSLNANSTTQFPEMGLACPGLPNLTWIVIQTAGAAGATVTPQISIRRADGIGQGAGAIEDYIALGPPALLVPDVSTVFEFNAPVEAMRLQIVAPAGNAVTIKLALLASG